MQDALFNIVERFGVDKFFKKKLYLLSKSFYFVQHHTGFPVACFNFLKKKDVYSEDTTFNPYLDYVYILKTKIESKLQKKMIFNEIMNGNNVFITGQAGTGKSYITEKILKKIENIKKERNEYFVAFRLSTTGVSANNLNNGMTIHTWSGIYGRQFEQNKSKGMSIKEIAFKKAEEILLCNDTHKKEKYVKILERWMRTDLLFIDEISMLSSDLLEYFDQFGRIVRSNHRPFGGIQLIILGDFFQLPPVSTSGPIKFAFNYSEWGEVSGKTFELKYPQRQNPDEFFFILSKMRKGETITPRESSLVKSRRFYDITKIENKSLIEIYPRNEQVNNRNIEYLKNLNGEEIVINPIVKNSRDEDIDNNLEKEILRTLNIQDLKLKVGCKLLITKNLFYNEGLFNGTLVKFVSYDTKSDILTIRQKKKTTKITRSGEYIEFDNSIYVLLTFPVKIGHAITIHKSQGSTITKGILSIDNAFCDSIVYTALSRFKSLEGLFLVGNMDFTQSKVSKFVKEWDSSVNSNSLKIEIEKWKPIDEEKFHEIIEIAKLNKCPVKF